MNHLILRHAEEQADRPKYKGEIRYCQFFSNWAGTCKLPVLKHPCNVRILLPLLKSNLDKHGSFVDWLLSSYDIIQLFYLYYNVSFVVYRNIDIW